MAQDYEGSRPGGLNVAKAVPVFRTSEVVRATTGLLVSLLWVFLLIVVVTNPGGPWTIAGVMVLIFLLVLPGLAIFFPDLFVASIDPCGDCIDDCECCQGGGGCPQGMIAAAWSVVLRRPKAPLSPPERKRLASRLAHHPDTPAFANDVYRIGSTRLCIGCFTLYPCFVVTGLALVLVRPDLNWVWVVTGGLALAVMQGISSAGWARTRRLKAFVKASFGIGLGCIAGGVLISPLTSGAQAAILFITASLAAISVIPRSLRMARCRQAISTIPSAR